MKVLLINDYDFIIGGAEVIFFNTRDLLVSHGHEVKTFGAKSKAKLPPILKGWFSISYLLKSYTLIKNFRPDIIHVHGCIREISPSVLLNAKFFNIPLIYTVHDFDLLGPEITLIHKSIPYIRAVKLQFQNFLIESCVHAFISPSRSLQSLLTKKFKNIPVFYIPNFVKSISTYTPVVNNQNYLICIGRLTKEKGFDVAIKAFKTLLEDEKYSTYNLHIIGEGAEKENLKNLTKQLELNKNIHFLGHLSGEALNKQYKHCIGVIIPSSYMENSPLVAYEAMCNHKPVIASNVGGLPDLVKNNETGYLFKMDDFQDLVKHIKLLLKGKESLRLGSNAYNYMTKELNEDNYYQNLVSTYTKIQP